MPFPLSREGLWQEGPPRKWRRRWNSRKQCWESITVPLGPDDQHASKDPLFKADKAGLEEFDADLEVFKVVVEHLRHNLTIYWQQADFFVLIQGGLLTAYTAFISKPIVPVLGWFGIVLSVFWWLAAYGRWRLINKWRDEVRSLDLAVDRHRAFYRVETAIKDNRSGKLFVPAFAGLFLPWLIAFLWIIAIFVLTP